MNLVLRDYFRRWWWMILLAAIGQTLLLGPERGAKSLSPLLSLFVGIIPLLMDICRGTMRVQMQLPIRREEMATKMWLVTVLLPAAITAAVSFVGQVGHRFFQPTELFHPLTPVRYGIAALLMCGSMFAAFAGATPGGHSWKERIQAIFYVLVVLFSVGGPLLLALTRSGDEFNWKAAAIMGFASLATWFGWRNRENLVCRNSLPPMAQISAESRLARQPQHRAPAGIGGWSFLLQSTAQAYATCMVMMVILMLGIRYVFSTIGDVFKVGKKDGQADHFLSVDNSLVIGIWVVVIVIALRPVVQARALRMLPIRPAVLAGVFVGLPLLLNVITMGLHFGAAWIIADATKPAWGTATQMTFVFLIAIPVILRWGMTNTSLSVMSTLAIIFITITSHFKGLHPFLLQSLVVLVPLCFLLTHRLLSFSSNPYRRDLFRLPGWQGQAR